MGVISDDLGGAAYFEFSGDLLLTYGYPRVLSVKCTAASSRLLLPPSSQMNPGGPAFIILNIGPHTFTITDSEQDEDVTLIGVGQVVQLGVMADRSHLCVEAPVPDSNWIMLGGVRSFNGPRNAFYSRDTTPCQTIESGGSSGSSGSSGSLQSPSGSSGTSSGGSSGSDGRPWWGVYKCPGGSRIGSFSKADFTTVFGAPLSGTIGGVFSALESAASDAEIKCYFINVDADYYDPPFGRHFIIADVIDTYPLGALDGCGPCEDGIASGGSSGGSSTGSSGSSGGSSGSPSGGSPSGGSPSGGSPSGGSPSGGSPSGGIPCEGGIICHCCATGGTPCSPGGGSAAGCNLGFSEATCIAGGNHYCPICCDFLQICTGEDGGTPHCPSQS